MMRVDYKAFGNRLRAYRLARHLTQEQLGEIVGVSYQHIGMLERGRRSPSMEMLISLCYALDCTCDSLFEDSLPEQDACTLRQRPLRLRNTLTNWILVDQPDESLAPDFAVDLRLLPPLAFSAIDEDLPTCSSVVRS